MHPDRYGVLQAKKKKNWTRSDQTRSRKHGAVSPSAFLPIRSYIFIPYRAELSRKEIGHLRRRVRGV